MAKRWQDILPVSFSLTLKVDNEVLNFSCPSRVIQQAGCRQITVATRQELIKALDEIIAQAHKDLEVISRE